MPRGPSWPQSIPELPYVRHTSYAGQDVFINMTFLDSTQTPVQPTTINYEIDSLESAVQVQGQTPLTPTGTSQILQIPGSVLQLTRTWYGRENMQVWITATYTDGATGNTSTMQQIVLIELVGIATAPQ